jgi:hypothetical protein
MDHQDKRRFPAPEPARSVCVSSGMRERMDTANPDRILSGNGLPARMELSVFCFEEDGLHYAYAPSLDLTGYGNDASEAWQSLEVSVEAWVDLRKRDGDLDRSLRGLGWRPADAAAPAGTLAWRQAPSTNELRDMREELRDLLAADRSYRQVPLVFPEAHAG